MPNVRALEQSRHIAETAVGFAGGEAADSFTRDLADEAMKRR